MEASSVVKAETLSSERLSRRSANYGLEDGIQLLNELDAAKDEEVELQQALCWASVMATEAKIATYSKHINEKGPELRAQAEADQEAAKQEKERLEEENAAKVHLWL